MSTISNAASTDAPREDGPVDGGAAASQPRGARALQDTLARSLDETKSPSSQPGAQPRPTVRRLAKAAVALAVAVGLGYAPIRALFVEASVEAVINARIETVRSPIDGWIESVPDPAAKGSGNAPSLKISNPLADRSRLDDLIRQREFASVEADSDAHQAAEARQAELALVAQADRFREERMRVLDARLREQSAAVDAATARATLAAAKSRRTLKLRDSGVVAPERAEQSDGDLAIAEAERQAAEQRVDETRVERAALERGVFIGDSYNDTPSSVQRADELRVRIGELDAAAEAARARAAWLTTAVEQEQARYRALSEVVVALPAKGRVWEMLAAPGEHVANGQDLLRVVDCSRPLVSADVDESVYNGLTIGAPALFRPAGASEEFLGRVVNLTGASAAPANFAIAPNTLRKSPFYVTVAVEGLADGGCELGRTGVVIFGAAAADAEAARALRGAVDAAAMK